MIKSKPQIIIIFTFLITISSTSICQANSHAQILHKFNLHMNRIDILLRKGEFKSACLEAQMAHKLIEEELLYLKNLEPQYNWGEIKNVLISIPDLHCNKSNLG